MPTAVVMYIQYCNYFFFFYHSELSKFIRVRTLEIRFSDEKLCVEIASKRRRRFNTSNDSISRKLEIYGLTSYRVK